MKKPGGSLSEWQNLMNIWIAEHNERQNLIKNK